MSLAIDTGFPVSTHVVNTTHTSTSVTIGTAGKQTSGPSLLLVGLQLDEGNNATAAEPTTLSGGGLTWNRIAGASGEQVITANIRQGAEWWYAISNSAITTSTTFTDTFNSGGGCSASSMVIYSITGNAGSPIGVTGVNMANSGALAIDVTVSAQAVNSFVFVVANDYAHAAVPTARTENSPWDDSYTDSGVGDAGGTGHATTSAVGNITVGSTSTSSARIAAAVEILVATAAAFEDDAPPLALPWPDQYVVTMWG